MVHARSILHVDMDAFYASVEQLDNPELRGKPIIVGGSGNRGVVAAASYEVRKFGVHSAMPTRQAMQLCPHAICVRPRFERYKAASAIVFGVFHEFTPIVEGLSLDEAFLDVTASHAAFGPATTIATEIKARIHSRTGLTASVGVAPNKLVAKIASDLRKPDGLVVIEPHEIQGILDPLSIRRLFGIGNKTAPHLEQIGIKTLGDLRAASESILQPVFGRYAARMHARAAGIDDRPVIADWDEKQISAEETFDIDLTDRKRIHAALAQLADRMAIRLRNSGWLAGCVVVKIRRKDFKTYTRQSTLRPITNETKPLVTAAEALLDEWLLEQPRAAVRLLGIGARDLTLASQLDMFAAAASQKNQSLDATLDSIRAKFGTTAVGRGSSLRDKQ
jgi:DNA polymerase-4